MDLWEKLLFAAVKAFIIFGAVLFLGTAFLGFVKFLNNVILPFTTNHPFYFLLGLISLVVGVAWEFSEL